MCISIHLHADATSLMTEERIRRMFFFLEIFSLFRGNYIWVVIKVYWCKRASGRFRAKEMKSNKDR